MTNLLEETEDIIKHSGYQPNNIIFIGSLSSGHRCTWDEFCKLANFDYDAGYGGQEISDDLRVIFDDYTYLIRREYDGSEWWEYVPKIVIPEINKPIHELRTGYWSGETLAEINK